MVRRPTVALMRTRGGREGGKGVSMSVTEPRSEAGVRRPPVEAEPTAEARASKHRAVSAASSFASSLTEIFNR